MTTPAQLQQQYETVPEELRSYPQWVVWTLHQKPDKPKPDKIPVNPHTFEWASVSNNETWGTYDAAMAALTMYPQHYQGLGFVFTEDDPFAFIDLDNVKVGTQWNPLVQEALSKVPSWSEFSQSGEGIHIIAKAEGASAKTQGLELYQYGRFVAMTGRQIPDTPKDIQACQAGVDWFRELIRKQGGNEERPPSKAPTNPLQQGLDRLGFSYREKDHGAKLELDYCPWHHEHTTGPGGAVFMLAHHNGRPDDAFFCQHASCQGRNISTLRGFVEAHDPEYAKTQQTDLPFQVVTNPDQPWEEPKIQEAQPRQLFISASQCVLDARKPVNWNIKGIMEAGQVGLLYGDSQALKSYLALDMSMHMVTGTPWHGRKIQQAPVWFLAGEGNAVLNRRTEALRQHMNLNEAAIRDLYISHTSHNFMQEGWINALNDMLLSVDSRPPGLIIIDTMARNAIMDENSAKDIGEFVDRCALLAQYWNTTVLIVHHTGKNKAQGARGSYALEANTDFRYKLERVDHPGQTLTGLHVEKLKGAPEPDSPLVFIARTKTVLGIVEDGQPYTDLILEPLDQSQDKCIGKNAFKLNKTQIEVMNAFFAIHSRLADTDAYTGVAYDELWEVYRSHRVHNGKKADRPNFRKYYVTLVSGGQLREEESNGSLYVLQGVDV